MNTEKLNEIKSDVITGAKAAAASQIVNNVVDGLEKVLGEKYPDLLKTDVGQRASRLIAASLCKLALDISPTLSQNETARQLATLAVETKSRDLVEPYIGFALELVQKSFNNVIGK